MIINDNKEIPAMQYPFKIAALGMLGLLAACGTNPKERTKKLAHALSKRNLELAFGCYLFIVGGRFVISLLNGQ